MRHLKVTIAEVETVVAAPEAIDEDENGNSRYHGDVRGRVIRVVVAADEPDFVKSVHERKRMP